MHRRELPYIELKLSSPRTGKSLCSKALVDTGANTTCIPERLVATLGLHEEQTLVIEAVTGRRRYKRYLVNIQIEDNSFQQSVVAIDSLKEPLLGWDIFAQKPLLIVNKIFGQIVHILNVIPSLKQNNVLILGQDTSKIHRLHAIQKRLKSHGYVGIIPKDIVDIDIQSTEEKVNMLASLCRFIICENSFPSGHIDELKICSFNRFVTAILQEKNRGATWMQADYPLDFSFMNTFTYSNKNQINLAVDNAVDWAEQKIQERQEYFNKLYNWRESNK